MEIEVKINNQILLFDHWKFGWRPSRSVKLINGQDNNLHGQEVIVREVKYSNVADYFEVAWFGHLLFPLEKIYNATPFKQLKSTHPAQTMEYLDQFLLRANNFAAFI